LPLAGAALALLLAALAANAQVRWGLWLPWSGAALFAILASITLAVAEHALTRAQRERLSAHLGAYLPAPMAARLAAIDPTGRLEVERREVTVMVADIRNFSAFALHQTAEETAAVLHAFSCLAVDIVERHGGVVENLVGDSVVAVWNGYADRPDHPRHALDAARELLREAGALLSAAAPDPEGTLVQPLALGIGLETGDAIVGSFGPARRRAHAALGEPVTVAVRLQAMTQDLSVPILIGPRLAAAQPAGTVVSQGEYLLEGLSRHCELFAPAAWPEWAPAETVFPDPPVRRQPASGSVDALLTAPQQLASARALRDL
jgi:adenylate cyclase